jgi:hypothetical protein
VQAVKANIPTLNKLGSNSPKHQLLSNSKSLLLKSNLPF